jgi:hypothetical protein
MVGYLSFLKHACLWELQRGRSWQELEHEYMVDRTPRGKNETEIGSRSAA